MAVALLFNIPGIVFAAQDDLKPQTTCPVMGGIVISYICRSFLSVITNAYVQ